MENPSDNLDEKIIRQAVRLADVTLTDIVIDRLPYAVRPRTLKRKAEAANVEDQVKDTAFAKRRERTTKRQGLSDFERFKVMRLKKVAKNEVKKTQAKIRAAA